MWFSEVYIVYIMVIDLGNCLEEIYPVPREFSKMYFYGECIYENEKGYEMK